MDARFEEFKLDGTEVDTTGFQLASSLEYNHDLYAPMYFSPDKDADVASPEASDGFYAVTIATEWIPQIMYEFRIDTTSRGFRDHRKS